MQFMGTVACTIKITLETATQVQDLLNQLKDDHVKESKSLMGNPHATDDQYGVLQARRRRLAEGNLLRALLARGLEEAKRKDRAWLKALMDTDPIVRGHPGSDKVASRGRAGK